MNAGPTTVEIPVEIPTPLRRFTGDQAVVAVAGADVAAALADLVTRHPDLRPHLYTADGQLRSFVNVFKNDENVRDLARGATPLAAGDTLTIIPSIAGGRP